MTLLCQSMLLLPNNKSMLQYLLETQNSMKGSDAAGITGELHQEGVLKRGPVACAMSACLRLCGIVLVAAGCGVVWHAVEGTGGRVGYSLPESMSMIIHVAVL